MTYHRLAFNKTLTRSFLGGRRRSRMPVGSVIVYLFIAPVFMMYVSLVFSMFVLGLAAELVYNGYRMVR